MNSKSPSMTPVSSSSQLATMSNQFYWPSLLPRDGQGNVTNPSLKWRLGSRLVVPTVGFFSKFWMTVANTSVVHNADVLHKTLSINYEASYQRRKKDSSVETFSQSPQYSKLSSISNANSCFAKASVWDENESTPVTNDTSSSACHQKSRPLITYSNHSSCMDDPLLWGALIPFCWQFNSDRHRWSVAAAEICFTKHWHSFFFSLGKTFPIIRGIYQPAMNYASNLMKAGAWLHFFPEGKVISRREQLDSSLLHFANDENGKLINGGGQTVAAAMIKKKQESLKALSEPSLCDRLVTLMEQKSYSLKWGMARLIIEHVLGEGHSEDDSYQNIRPSVTNTSGYSLPIEIQPNREEDTNDVLPEVDILPIYHVGMDDVLPTRQPYIPRMFHRVTILVRPEGPIRIDKKFLQKLFDTTDKIEEDGGSGSAKKVIPKKIELSLTEKRIRLMRFLEDELNKLGSKAHWLHERWNETVNNQ